MTTPTPGNPHRERQRALLEAQLERATRARRSAMNSLDWQKQSLDDAQAAVDAAGADIAALQALLNSLR